MVNVFSGSIASGPGNLQVAKKVVVTVEKFLSTIVMKYSKAMCLDLHLTDYTRM